MSPVSSIRSAARGTSSAYRSVPLRWRIAGGSALLTFVILLGFAAIVGALTTSRIRDDFNADVDRQADEIPVSLAPYYAFEDGGDVLRFRESVDALATGDSVIRVLALDGKVLEQTRGPAPDLGPPTPGTRDVGKYRVETRDVQIFPYRGQFVVVQYARPTSSVGQTTTKVWFFLLLGVGGGTLLALLAGLGVARRAMAPIANLTATAAEIERTRDPSRHVPVPAANDEVAELARTLDGMLESLDAARRERIAAFHRQREFVADASHELRTPLTSVLANLELLEAELDGEQAATAASALRATHRMRRLVNDLLLLARADAGQQGHREPLDLGRIANDVVSELEPVGADHDLDLQTDPAPVVGVRDELFRVGLNLVANAISHTPPGTQIRVRTGIADGEAQLVVEDDGPGIPEEHAARVFDRFVRGVGDSGGSTGLGLAIVHAVATGHDGSVRVEPTPGSGGARFVVQLPAAAVDDESPAAEAAAETARG